MEGGCNQEEEKKEREQQRKEIKQMKQSTKSITHLSDLAWFDSRSSDHQRNTDVKLIKLPLVIWKPKLACKTEHGKK